MYLASKKVSLLILGLTAIACSRLMFVFFDDPEGPNLLVVMVAAAVVYALSLAVYIPSSTTPAKKLVLAILTQILLVTGFYFFLR